MTTISRELVMIVLIALMILTEEMVWGLRIYPYLTLTKRLGALEQETGCPQDAPTSESINIPIMVGSSVMEQK